MDREAANAKGVEPLAPVLQSIDEAGSRAELAVVMGRLSRLGLGTPFGNFVDSDDKNPDRSAEHTSELQSLMRITYAVFCLKKKKTKHATKTTNKNNNSN